MNGFLKLYWTLSSIKWNLYFLKKILCDSDFREKINRNKVLRNSRENKRCFIVGNGPSLKEMELEKLHDETVFTVNFLVRNKKLYELLNPSYHVFIDPYFTEIEDMELQRFLEAMENVNPSITYITDIRVLKKLKSLGRGDKSYGVYMHDNWNRFGSKNIDLSSNLFSSMNVVQTAIYTAIYMGFSEIYLIGCDMTVITEYLYMRANNTFNYIHAYDIKESEKEQYKKELSSGDNYSMLYEYMKVFEIFNHLFDYSVKHNIKIYNATKGGILDMFPRVNLKDL